MLSILALSIGVGSATARVQSGDDLDTLDRLVVQLYRAGKYAEATDCRQTSIGSGRTSIRPAHPEVGAALKPRRAAQRPGPLCGGRAQRALAITEKAARPRSSGCRQPPQQPHEGKEPSEEGHASNNINYGYEPPVGMSAGERHDGRQKIDAGSPIPLAIFG
jgi:hypothetical protein